MSGRSTSKGRRRRHAGRAHPPADAQSRHRDLEHHAELASARVATDSRTRLLNDPLPGRRFVWRLDRQRMTGTLDLPNSAMQARRVAASPMLGRVAVAPAGTEVFGGLWPGDFGGNMDAADVHRGRHRAPADLPSGALFYFGDFHALQGDGEIAGSGLESTAT
jgi:hypothetical protein